MKKWIGKRNGQIVASGNMFDFSEKELKDIIQKDIKLTFYEDDLKKSYPKGYKPTLKEMYEEIICEDID